MSFTSAALIVVAIVAVVLGLTCYHLLNRLDRLENAVLGGLQPPSTRLSREQFERRFRDALQRVALARNVDTGLVLIFGPEVREHDIAAALGQLRRADGITLFGTTDGVVVALDELLPNAGATMCPDDVDPPSTPYLFVIDQARVVRSRPLATAADLLDTLGEVT